MSFRIKEVWAFVTIGDDDEEGVCGFCGPDGRWMPMVCADQKRIDSIRPFAEEIAKVTNKKVTLVKFHQREDVEDIHPNQFSRN